MRRSFLESLIYALQKGEKRLIRILAIAFLALAVVQLGRASDPLEFYLAFAEKVESAALEVDSAQISVETLTPPPQQVNQTQTQTKTWNITLKAQPAAMVKVSHNGKLLGTLSKGTLQITVPGGNIQLDGRGIKQTVRVQVVQIFPDINQPRINQVFPLYDNVQLITVIP